MVSQKTGTRGRNSSGEAYSATQGELAERALSVLPPPVAAANLPGALAGLNQSPQGYPPRHYPEAVVKGAREDLQARGETTIMTFSSMAQHHFQSSPAALKITNPPASRFCAQSQILRNERSLFQRQKK